MASSSAADEQVDLSTIPVSPAMEDNPHAPFKSAEAATVTVFHDKDNFNVKHPLQSEWTLWFTKPPSGKGDNWNDLLKQVITFDSVEEFWGVYNNIAGVSDLALKSDYHLFRAGVRPEWEDPQNKHGGKWSYSYKDRRSTPIDERWLHVMLPPLVRRSRRRVTARSWELLSTYAKPSTVSVSGHEQLVRASRAAVTVMSLVVKVAPLRRAARSL